MGSLDGVEGGVITPMRLTPAIGVQRSAPRPELKPIFTELATRWESAGRSVPGRAGEK